MLSEHFGCWARHAPLTLFDCDCVTCAICAICSRSVDATSQRHDLWWVHNRTSQWGERLHCGNRWNYFFRRWGGASPPAFWEWVAEIQVSKPIHRSPSRHQGPRFLDKTTGSFFWHPGHSPQSRTVDLVRDPGTACQKWAGKEASVLPTSRQHRPRCLHTPGFLHLRSYWERVWNLPKNSRVGDMQQAQRPAIPSGDGCHPSEAGVCYTSVEHHLPSRQQAFVYTHA